MKTRSATDLLSRAAGAAIRPLLEKHNFDEGYTTTAWFGGQCDLFHEIFSARAQLFFSLSPFLHDSSDHFLLEYVLPSKTSSWSELKRRHIGLQHFILWLKSQIDLLQLLFPLYLGCQSNLKLGVWNREVLVMMNKLIQCEASTCLSSSLWPTSSAVLGPSGRCRAWQGDAQAELVLKTIMAFLLSNSVTYGCSHVFGGFALKCMVRKSCQQLLVSTLLHSSRWSWRLVRLGVV